jgi:hypothetical protein
VLLSGYGEDVPEFIVTVETYRCDTLDDVKKLYGTFDSRLSVRTASEPTPDQAEPSTIPLSSGVDPETLTGLAALLVSLAEQQESEETKPRIARAPKQPKPKRKPR